MQDRRLLHLRRHQLLSIHIPAFSGEWSLKITNTEAQLLQAIRTGCLQGLSPDAVNLTQDQRTLGYYQTARFNRFARLDCSAVTILDLVVEYGRVHGTLLATVLSVAIHSVLIRNFSWFTALVFPGVFCLAVSTAYTDGILIALFVVASVVVALLVAHSIDRQKSNSRSRRRAAVRQSRRPGATHSTIKGLH